jgi:hypothetical protein
LPAALVHAVIDLAHQVGSARVMLCSFAMRLTVRLSMPTAVAIADAVLPWAAS